MLTWVEASGGENGPNDAMSNTMQDVQALSSHTNMHKFGEIQWGRVWSAKAKSLEPQLQLVGEQTHVKS